MPVKCPFPLLIAVLVSASLLLGGASCQPAWAILVDGVLDDWGVFPGPYSNGPSQWVPLGGIDYVQEDQDPAIDFLNPGWGGQPYDVEAIYFTQDAATAFFAVVTGFPLAGYGGYTAGDFAFDFGSDGTYEYGLETVGAHDLYGNVTWINPIFGVSSPYAIGSGTNLGPAAFGYVPGQYAANTHYAFEMGIPLSYFSGYWDEPGEHPNLTVHWTMSCGNDALNMRLVPEPSTWLLLT